MNASLFNDFVASADTLRVYDGDGLLFASAKDGLQPMLEYSAQIVPRQNDITIFDKIMGNAAALLAVRADCHRVYSPLASQLAINTLTDSVKKLYARIDELQEQLDNERVARRIAEGKLADLTRRFIVLEAENKRLDFENVALRDALDIAGKE